jgi:hypothetical protein
MADGSSGSGETDRIFFGSLENEVKARISKVSISQIILYISFGICSQVYASPQLEQLFPFSFFFFFCRPLCRGQVFLVACSFFALTS